MIVQIFKTNYAGEVMIKKLTIVTHCIINNNDNWFFIT